MTRDFSALADAIQYFQDIGPQLYELEKQIKEIKQSKEFVKHRGTLSTYANRDIIDQCPRFKNGYSVPQEVYINDESQKTEDFLKKFLDERE